MSVLACDRGGCDNIMCDRLSDDFGYICNECFDEMVAEQITSIGAFMDSFIEIPRESYERIFPLRRNPE